MKIIVFGAAGQVGAECVEVLDRKGYTVFALTRSDVDFAKPDEVSAKILQLEPDFVVNCCAYTAVDKAESERALADLVNHQSVLAMANTCSQYSIPLMHLSTDYVFDGEAAQPCKEEDPVSPLGVYGETKLAGEQAIQGNMDRYIILRTSWVFGEKGNNFVKTMLRVGAERNQLKVVNDQQGRPSYVGDIVSAVLYFIDIYRSDNSLPWGLYHCSSEGVTTWYGFAQCIFEEAVKFGVIDKAPEVLPIPSSEYSTPAPRPAYSVLSTEKLTSFMRAPLPNWQQGLQVFMKNINVN